MQIRAFQTTDEAAVIRLWTRCGLTRPWNNPKSDIRRKLEFQPDLFWVGLREENIIASVMAGYEGHRGWIQYLAVDPDHHRRGVGRAIMGHAEAALERLGAPKINLQVRSDNAEVIEFYRRLGYEMEARASLGKRLRGD
ncbi:MAG: GNAT family acetyltransferase, partial [Myxococcota bacterium]|nr:GNAT family acetyltransferase [Myxococcota bacterium]